LAKTRQIKVYRPTLLFGSFGASAGRFYLPQPCSRGNGTKKGKLHIFIFQ
jgi:hypothetical protein